MCSLLQWRETVRIFQPVADFSPGGQTGNLKTSSPQLCGPRHLYCSVAQAEVHNQPTDGPAVFYAQKLPSEAHRAFPSNKSDSSRAAGRVVACFHARWSSPVRAPWEWWLTSRLGSLRLSRCRPSSLEASSKDSTLRSPPLTRHKSPVPGPGADTGPAQAAWPSSLIPRLR